jgi:phosphoserine phosphatase/pimeloyl-ACP methyl ester carboxylesterase
VEGTLLTESFPGLVLAYARRTGIMTAKQRFQAGAFGMLGRVLPGGAGRAMQAVGIIRAVAGSTVADMERVLDAMMPAVLAALKPEMVARLRQHQAVGYELVLLSGGLHAGIARLAAALGGRGEGTKMRIVGGRYTGQLDGPICQGQGKAARAASLLHELGADPAESIAYGDTASDAAFLVMMGHPHAVDPDAKLAAIARDRGWPIIRTGQSASGAPAIAAIPVSTDVVLDVETQAQAALRQFVTPRRAPLRPKEEAILAGATPLTFANGLVSATWGTGPTILLVHGWEGRGTNFGAFIDPLVTAGYRVVALDGPAHGASPGDTTYPLDFALRLVEVGQELGPLAGIIGHSMGGASTMLALQRGLQVERVVIISTPSSLFGVVRRFAQMVELPDPVAERFFALMGARTDVAESEMDVAQVIKGITLPGIIFHDPEDAEVPFADAETIAAAWPTARLRVVEGRGHRRILLAPEVVNEAVMFLTMVPKGESVY